MNPQDRNSDNSYLEAFTSTYLPDEEYQMLDLAMSDEDIKKTLVNSLDDNVAYWNQEPWNLSNTDVENTNFLLGDQLGDEEFLKNDSRYVDNRLFSSLRAILSYATGQLARPELTPSRGDAIYIKGAKNMESALYQHAADNKVDVKTRACVTNLLVRKRGPMKLRWDPNAGSNGDIVTEVCNPEDVIIDRYARFLDNPNVIYHRLRCSVQELISRFPKKEADIRAAFSIKQGRFSQMSKYVTYFEAWFTYYDADNKPCEAVAWFLHDPDVVLDKMPNPNWLYNGNLKKQKENNLLSIPPKPFVWFNYINMGHSYVDETCLIDQAKPLQKMLNKRGRQIMENADYVNGRWVASVNAFSVEDAQKFINKGAKTVALADTDDVSKALMNVASEPLPSYVYQTLLDSRNEIDSMMGTPSVFKGSQPDSQDTLGRDIMIKQQAGMLQDDLVRAVSAGMEDYYKILLQMMRVYYTDDYWFQVKGGDGKYEFILLNSDTIDANVKIGVQVDSTLPLDKEQIRATAMGLWKAGEAIDYKTFMEDLGLPNPDIRAERYMRSKLDPLGYLSSIEEGQMDDEAEVDIMLLTQGKTPEERDEYDEHYINYFNTFMTSNRFQKLPADAQQRITAFLMVVQHLAMQTANLQDVLDDAGMPTAPINPPAPQRSIKIVGQLDPQESAQAAGMQPAPQAPPIGQPPMPPTK